MQTTARTTVSLIEGDGIGHEVVQSAVRILASAGAPIDWEPVEAGAAVFRKGIASGVPAETIESISRTRLVLKGPLETPVGYGEKSANVTLRKLFETFGNIRPVKELAGVPTPFSGRGIDLIVVRENVEDLYAGIEHMQTPNVAQCLKLISRPGCERVVRLAFEVARAEGRTDVACATKANIMKLTEGLLKRVFEEIAPEYPDINARHIIVDNAAHQLVRRPEQFQVIVTTNMNGDILSDLTSGLIGGLGFAGSANVGASIAIFEAVHGSAPKYAGADVANPTAITLSAVMLLRHIGAVEIADQVEAAIHATLAAGIHTRDVQGGEPVGTVAFTDAVISRLDTPVEPSARTPLKIPTGTPTLVTPDRARRRRRRRVRRVPRLGRRSRAERRGTRRGQPLRAQDDLEPRHDGLPVERHEASGRRSIPMPLPGPRGRRALGSRDPRPARPRRRHPPLGARREAAVVRWRAGVHARPGRGSLAALRGGVRDLRQIDDEIPQSSTVGRRQTGHRCPIERPGPAVQEQPAAHAVRLR